MILKRSIPFVLMVCLLIPSVVPAQKGDDPGTPKEAYDNYLKIKKELRKKPDGLKPEGKNRWAAGMLRFLLIAGTNANEEIPEDDYLAVIQEALGYGPKLIVKTSYRSNDWIIENWRKAKKPAGIRITRMDSEEKRQIISRFIAETRFWDYFTQREVDILIKYIERHKTLEINEKAELDVVYKEQEKMLSTLTKLGADQIDTNWQNLFKVRKKELDEEITALETTLETSLTEFNTYLTDWRKRIDGLEMYSAAWQTAYDEYKTRADETMKIKTELEDEIRRMREELQRLDAWLEVAQ
ncbi:hypothetical protein ACFLU6_08885 [Acidobacteriota bacterium]